MAYKFDSDTNIVLISTFLDNSAPSVIWRLARLEIFPGILKYWKPFDININNEIRSHTDVQKLPDSDLYTSLHLSEGRNWRILPRAFLKDTNRRSRKPQIAQSIKNQEKFDDDQASRCGRTRHHFFYVLIIEIDSECKLRNSESNFWR